MTRPMLTRLTLTRLLLLSLLLSLPLSLSAAINPQHYVDGATDHLRLREITRVVQVTEVGDARLQRVSLVVEVLEERDPTRGKVGRILLIDYTVDLTARENAAKAHAERMGNMPGPQFLAEPRPPTPDADGTYWAHLSLAGEARRYAGAAGSAYEASGEVYVPAAAQYSFDR